MTISYEQLKELNLKYANRITESVFAINILGIASTNYYSCRSSRKTNVKILKSKKVKLTPQLIADIITDLIEKENCFPGMSISYEQLREWHQKYGHGMQEIEFARMLQIPDKTYYAKSTCRILGGEIKNPKEQKKGLTRDEIQDIIMKLTEQGYVGRKISYSELHNLYLQHGEKFDIGESYFAQKVLGINYSNYYACKKRGTNVIILKDKREITAPMMESRKKRQVTQDEIQDIIMELTQQGYVGRRLSYSELQNLYLQHGEEKCMTECEFAMKILGITAKTYRRCRDNNRTVIVRNSITYSKSKEILRLYINKAKFYSKEYINEICAAYDISIEDFIIYVYIQGFIGDISYILNALEKNGGLWIGKIRLSEEFANKNIDLIKRIVSKTVRSLCSTFHRNGEREDYIQEAILYVIETMGEVERNFGDDLNRFESVIRARIQKYCQGMIIDGFAATSINSGFTRTDSSGTEYEIQIPDPTIDVERDVIQSQSPSDLDNASDRCIKLLIQYIEAGCDRTTALVMAAEDMNIEPDKMLEYMQHYLITNGKVKIKPNGTVEWDPR